ncbi:MAG: PEP-CTERM sorting domain-containing protein, partial [Chthoniobacterales bacterium]
NTFMGDGYNLLSGAFDITGFDLYPVNNSGTDYTGLKITIYVWGAVNTTGTVNATTPAFSNLLNTYTLTTAGTFTNGFYFPFESATPGVTPGITLGAPLTIPSSTVGLTFAYQGTTDGVNFASANGLSSTIAGGPAPTVGSDVFNGYYRNANSETNGNFTSSLRSLGGIGAQQSVMVRVYGDAVPEPSTLALVPGGVGLLLFLRRKGLRKSRV